MYVKASRIANLTDARYFAAREVTYLGFCLDEHSAYFVEPALMSAIREWVAGPRIVGEFEQSSAAVVREAATFFALDAVQVSRVDWLSELQGLEVILRLEKVESPGAVASLLEQVAPQVRFFQVEMTASAAQAAVRDVATTAAWRQLCARAPVLLDAPLPANEMAALLAAVQPAGFALSGSTEERPGFKSFEDVDALFEALNC